MNQASKRIAVVGVAGSMLAGDNLSPYTGGAGTWAQPPGVHPYTPAAIDPYAGRVTKPCAGKARCKGRTSFPQTYRLEIIRPGQRPKVLLENAPVGPFGIEPSLLPAWLSPATGPAKRITGSFPEAAPHIRGPVNRTQR